MVFVVVLEGVLLVWFVFILFIGWDVDGVFIDGCVKMFLFVRLMILVVFNFIGIEDGELNTNRIFFFIIFFGMWMFCMWCIYFVNEEEIILFFEIFLLFVVVDFGIMFIFFDCVGVVGASVFFVLAGVSGLAVFFVLLFFVIDFGVGVLLRCVNNVVIIF